MKILLVEDDIEISLMLTSFLKTEAFEIEQAFDGEEACRLFDKDEYSIVLLDLMIPKISGIRVLEYIRTKSTVPIIIMSAKDSDSDKTLGLSMGADDYITKPFSITEVLARIKANIRRNTQYATCQPASEKKLTYGELELDENQFVIKKNGQLLDLRVKEYEIMRLLLKNPNRVYTKAQMYSIIWKDEYLGDENALNVHISRLRNKVEDDSRKPKYISTVWGIGYKLGAGNER